MKLQKAGLVGLAAALAAVGIAAPSIAGGNKYTAVSDSRDCGDGDTVVLNGPLKLWPPNHKFVDEPVTATDADGAGPVELTLMPDVQDASGGDGGSNHDPDFNATSEDGETLVATGDGSATAGLQLRAERSGKGDGRTYVINWTAMFDDKTCSSGDEGQTPFVIEVPHDMRGGADWK
ncbi:MAG: hypothetical protein Q8R60_00270 [Mycobacteriales bacterium]|nr:hypothetical protein [Mycobacteriales bacterium]